MKKIFAMFAIAALAFAVGCGPETKTPVKIDKKPDGGTKVDLEVKPGEEAEVKVDDKGASVEVKPEEKPAEEKPADEKPAAEKPAEEKPAEEKPAEEKPAAEAPKAEDK